MPASLDLLLCLPFLFALLISLGRPRSRSTAAWLAGAAPLLGLCLLATMTPEILRGGIVRTE
ncbi:MAG: hypothetical protein OJK14_16905, partial [Achromobacter sp.]|uniref:hypothetical protein n=1 Tax=Achromobacter sp. TaxID=134375 RepID=UPI002586FFCA